jgi:uncharacterized protein (DUF433 family)
MSVETARKQQRDQRMIPLFRISEAAHYVNIPESTLTQWVYGRKFPTRSGQIQWSKRLIQAADERRGLLSFVNLAEAHVLQATRERDIPMKSVRAAIDYVVEQTGSNHPLVTQEFYTFGKSLFLRKLNEIVNASMSGQLALEWLDPYLERLVRDDTGLPYRVFPMQENPESLIMLDLRLGSGQPVITGTGILAEVICGRFETGETAAELAADYNIDERAVEHAVRYIKAAA